MTFLHRNLQASSEFPCAVELLFDILIDYDNYKEWLPLVRDSTLLAKEGDIAVVRLHPAIPHIESLSLECVQTPNRSVFCRVIDGEAGIVSLRWELAPLAVARCRVSLAVEKERRFPSARQPGFLEPGNTLSALWAYAGAYLPEIQWPGESGDKVLEIFESEHGLSCWFNGRQYEMRPVGGPK